MKPYQKAKTTKKVQIREMFNKISVEYDFLNRIITFGNDSRWRKRIYTISKKSNPKNILDIATGTADIAIELSKIDKAKIIGIDISNNMLEVGRKKIEEKKLSQKISLIHGDAENIKFRNNYFDIITIGFGVRNFENLLKGLNESHRVLKENGKLIILETSTPKDSLIKFFYKIFARVFLPLTGWLFSKDQSAYKYLQKSSETFPSGKDFIDILTSCGFKNVEVEPQMFGASSIYIAQKKI
ncbi:MAG: bifunctional demethylmenaquinone methyltransferase/2-methoxy-6-polyprenyl-1,4-benzoquinol methylase UbiE [Flavobacteriaceae bacterium]